MDVEVDADLRGADGVPGLAHVLPRVAPAEPVQLQDVRVTPGHQTLQRPAVQYSTVQYSAVQYSTVQYSAVQCSVKYLLYPTSVLVTILEVSIVSSSNYLHTSHFSFSYLY